MLNSIAMLMKTFKATIFKIGINPYVLLPSSVLQWLFKQADKDKGPITVHLIINKSSFAQTLVRYAGEWRLYLNMPMRKAASKDVGDEITISIEYDLRERNTPIHPKFAEALKKQKEAKQKFHTLPPSRQKEIVRYINNLKTEASVERNIHRALNFLIGKERFIGRDKP